MAGADNKIFAPCVPLGGCLASNPGAFTPVRFDSWAVHQLTGLNFDTINKFMPHADPAKAKAYFAARYQAKKSEIVAKQQVYRAEMGEAEHRRRRNEYNRNSKYGLKPGEFDTMLAAQGGKCNICEKVFADRAPGVRKGAPCIDHNHDTGQVRGLLCRGCNVTVGFMEKDTARAIKAVDYILAAEPLDVGWPAD